MSLSFLSNITLASNEEVKPSFISSKAPRSAVNRNPEGVKIRLFKNGAIYPSKELVETYSLEYQPKDSENPAFGFDIMSSKVFPNTSHLPQAFLILAIVAKSLPKVDVFGSTKYYSEEDAAADASVVAGTPKSSVLDQGNTTFGKDVLIPMLKEVYDFEFSEDTKFVDLQIVVDQPLKTNDGNYFIPKAISRGEKKGEIESVVRKDIDMFPLVLASMVEDSAEVEDTTEVEVEEANVPEMDLTKSSSEPTMEEILDGEEEETSTEEETLDVDGESIDPEISLDPETEEVEEAASEEDDEDFGDLKI